MKKLKIFILILLMVLTILPVNTLAEGEDKPSNEPDVSVYATKDDLMTKFTPNAGGTANNYGKIVFGKNSSGEAQEWYILGNDTGVNGGKDNTVILAKTPIVKDKKFYDLTNQGEIVVNGYEKLLMKSINHEDCIYPQDVDFVDNPPLIELNHYGTSDVRAYLKDITSTSEKGYFSTEELKMINSTVITTEDLYNNTSYTTEDKLYLPNKSIETDDTTMKIGSNNRISIQYGDYKIPYSFWLRSPQIVGENISGVINENKAQYANIGLVLLDGIVVFTDYAPVNTSEKQFYSGDILETRNIGVVPVGNLNLSNVLFASAAKADSIGTITSGATMALRLDGNDEDVADLYGSIGEVYYDNATNEIVANKGNTGYEVYLVVQGKDPNMTGNQNWYYSKKITGEETIKASEIKEALGLVSNVSLADSKIWLEINVDANGMTYAVQAKAVQEINSVKLSVPVPVAGNPIDSSVTCNTNGVGIYLTSWDTIKPEAGYYKQYTVTITLKCELGYKFASDVTGEINGNNVTVSNDIEDKKKVSYTFPHTKDKLISVTDPTITFENGTSLEVIKNSLPTHVKVTTEGRKEIELPVTWNMNAQPFKEYDSNDKGEQEFDVTGAVTLDDTFIYDDAVPSTTIHVVVKAVATATPANEENTYDDGGPFTTDICGNIYDRWNNKIYTAPGCKLDDGYVVPNTGAK